MQRQNFILSFLIFIQTYNLGCLDKQSLRNFGWKPLDKPITLLNSSLCKKIYSESKTCIKQEDFQNFLSNIYFVMQSNQTKIYTDLHDIIEDITLKFEMFYSKFSLNFSFHGKVITKEMRQKMEEVMTFIPKSSSELRKQILINQHQCLKAQIKLKLGTFCILSSDQASNFLKHNQHKINKNLILEKHNLLHTDEGTSPGMILQNNIQESQLKINEKRYQIKIENSATDTIIQSCMPFVEGSCLFSKIQQALDILQGRKISRYPYECNPKILKCKNNLNCPFDSKNYIINLLFGSSLDLLINEKNIQQVTKTLNKESGSWIEYFKSNFYYAKDNLNSNVQGTKAWMSEKFMRYADILKKNTFDYFVTSEGRDIVVEGEYSGISIETSEILSICAGFSFIVLQLFVQFSYKYQFRFFNFFQFSSFNQKYLQSILLHINIYIKWIEKSQYQKEPRIRKTIILLQLELLESNSLLKKKKCICIQNKIIIILKIKNVPKNCFKNQTCLIMCINSFSIDIIYFRSLIKEFQKGIRLDEESWYSVTPEIIARYISSKLIDQNTILDVCCGSGGNSIQFAKTSQNIISIDIDILKLENLYNNAKIYGVEQNICLVNSDILKLNNIKADVAFCSPPWGGVSDLKRDITPNFIVLLKKLWSFSDKLCFLLPKNINLAELVDFFAYLEKEEQNNKKNNSKNNLYRRNIFEQTIKNVVCFLRQFQ